MKRIRYLHKDTLEQKPARHTTYKTHERKTIFMKRNVLNAKRFLSLFLAVVMLLGMLPMNALTAYAADGVSYIERSWNGTEVVSETKTVTDYTVVTSSTTTMSNGWYVVNSDVTVSSRITVSGTVNLILVDGYTLTASAGVRVLSGNTLNIYGQDADTGAIVATGSSSSAGIGSSLSAAGTIMISGGTITATGDQMCGAGIGGGYEASGGTISIFGGGITATGANNNGSGIGGGGSNDTVKKGGDSGDIDIYGGIIFACGNGSKSDDIGAGGSSAGGGSKDVTILGGLIFDRNGNGTIGGTLYTLEKNWELPSGKTLTIESGKTLIVPKGVTLTTTGTLVNNGTIVTDCSDTKAYGGTILYSHSNLTYVPNDKTDTITATCGTNNTHSFTITLVADDSTVTYDGKEHGAIVQDTDNNWANACLEYPTIIYQKKLSESSWGEDTTDKPKDVGEYQATITVDGQSVSTTFTIEKKTIADGDVMLSPTSASYNGEDQAPTVMLTGLTENFDFTVNWNKTEIINADTYTATITGIGNFDGTATASFTIEPKVVTEPDIFLDGDSFEYDGTAKEPAVTVKDGNAVIPADEYSFAYSNNINVNGSGVETNNPTVTITDKERGNYTVSGSKYFTINKGEQEPLTITGKPETVCYGDKFTLGASGGTTDGSVTWEVTEGNSAEVDSATGGVSICGVGDFTITATMAGDDNYNDVTATWDGTSAKGTPTCTAPTDVIATYGDMLSSVVLENPDGNDNGTWSWMAVTGDENPPVGDVTDSGNTFYAKFVPEDENYNTVENIPVIIHVNKSEPTIAFNGYDSSRAYDKKALENPTEAQLTINGAFYSDVTFNWYKGEAPNGTPLEGAPADAGTYYVVASIAETTNTAAASATSDAITISQAELLSIKETLKDQQLSKYCIDVSEAIKELPATISYTTAFGDVSVEIQWTCANYDSTPQATNNFTWTVKDGELANYANTADIATAGRITLTNAEALEVKHTIHNQTITYKADTNPYDVSALFTPDEEAGDATYTITGGSGAGELKGSALTITKAGTIEVRMTTKAQGAYAEGEAIATLTVNKGTGNAVVTMDDWTYGGEKGSPVPASVTNGTSAVTYLYTGGTNYNSQEVPTDAGSYTVVATFAETDLYAETTAEDTFVIKQIQVTPSISGSVEKTYDGSDSVQGATKNTLSITLPGVLDADKEAVSATADYIYVGTDVGTTAIKATGITLSGDKAENYTLTTETATANVGTITKAKAPDIVWPTAGELTYGMKLSDSKLTSEDTHGTFKWANGDAIPTVKNNGYTVVYTPRDTKNYDYEGIGLTKSVEVTVEKAVPTYTVPFGVQAVYGQTLESVVLPGPSEDETPGAWTWVDAANTPVGDVGSNSFRATFTPEDTDNYNSVTELISLTVNQRELTVTGATATGRDYDGTDKVEITAVAVSGEMDGDNVSIDVDGLQGTLSSSNAGSYTSVKLPVLALKGTAAANYTLVQPTAAVSTKVTINRLTPQITLSNNNITKTYGDSAFYLGVTENNPEPDGVVTYTSDNEDVVVVSNDGTATIKGAGEATVTLSLNATTNCDAAESKTIHITVDKAENAPNMPGATISAAYSNKTVSDATLPEGWVWQESDKVTALEVGVPVTATAVYNGADKGNYNNEAVVITLTRSACNHENTELRDAKDASCTEEGYSGDTYCKDCGECVQPGYMTEKKQHAGGTATCTHLAKCLACGAEYGSLNPNNHEATKLVDKKEATCTADGYTGDKCCSGCNAVIEKGSAISASGHDYRSEITKQPTATEEGEKTYTCSVCGSIEVEKIPATGSGDDKNDDKKDDNSDDQKAPAVGERVTGEDGKATYQVTVVPGTDGATEGGVTYIAPTDKNATSVTIPATIVIDGVTYKVTKILDDAFAGNKKLTTVVIGDNITAISAKTFKGCTNLKSITIGNGVKSIPANTFKNFKKLTTVKMGDGVISIGKSAFSGCSKLKTVAIGKNVTSIGDKAFYKCTALTKVTIPSKVKTIGKEAFSGCKKLSTLTIGKNVTTIGDKAFYKCTALTKLTIPSKVKKIGKSAFYGCKKLKNITIKTKNLTSKNVGKNAFKGVGSKYYKKVVVKVPSQKYVSKYKKLLQSKGLSKKANVKK